MGLLLICPHCQDKLPLASRGCPACGEDLRNLPLESRRYFFGRLMDVDTTPPAPARNFAPLAQDAQMKMIQDFPATVTPASSLPGVKEVSLCEALDRILNKGAMLFGEVTISVADIDLVYLGLQVVLASMETARGCRSAQEAGYLAPNLLARGF